MTSPSHSPLRRRALGALAVVVLLAVIAPFAVFAVPGTVGADQSYVVLTGSMEPALSPGDAVVVDAVDAGAIAVGDVITYRRTAGDDVPTTHRVVDVVTGEAGVAFQTKGDANEDADAGLVTPDRLVGKVVLTIPYIGYVVQFVNSPAGFLALVVVPLGLLLLTEVWSMLGRRDPDAGATTAGTSSATAGTTAAAATDADETDGISFTQGQLTVATIVLTVAAVAGVLLAWERREAWAIGLAVGSSTTLLVALGMLWVGGGSPAPATPTGQTAVPVVHLPPEVLETPTVAVETAAELLTLGRETGHPVVHDPGTDRYVVFDGDAVYVAPAPDAAPTTDADEATTALATADADTAAESADETTAGDATDAETPAVEATERHTTTRPGPTPAADGGRE
jgi:signal peptidase